MNRLTLKFFLVMTLWFAVLTILSTGNEGHAKAKSNPKSKKVLSFKEAYILEPLAGSTVTAGYGTIKNETDEQVSVKLVAVEGFKAVELHETYQVEGNAGMRRIEEIKIGARKLLELTPGGNHLMLFDATRPLKAGEKLKAEFSVGGNRIEGQFKVKARKDLEK